MPAVKLGGVALGGSSGTGSTMSGLAGGAASVLGSVVGGVTGAAGGVLSSASNAANSSDGMRGLAVFISDIRNCKSREAEIKRINKELANIRSKFKGDKTLDGYQKKKYVCKLLFIFLLGHDIDFGYMEAVNLLTSNKYTEKQIGYLFISVLISPNNDLIKLVIQNIKNDLTSKNPVFVCLALNCISNMASSKEMAEAFGQDIPKFLTTGDCSDSIKQSASLCLLNLFRSHPEIIASHVNEWGSRVIHLLNDQHLGVVTSACGLIIELISKNPFEYKTCASLAVSRLSRIVTASYTDLQDYTYYFVPAPWLSILLLRLLQNWPFETPKYFDPATRVKLLECLDNLLNKAQEPPKSKKVQHSNARNAVLFEAIDLIAHLWSTSDGVIATNGEDKAASATESSLLSRGIEILARFLSHRETNLRYLALESLSSLLAVARTLNINENEDFIIGASVARHRDLIVSALRNERDPSVRRGAADLLYAACGATPETDCEFVCAQLADYLTGEGCVAPADYTAREETVLKMAALAERYAKDRRWYLDTILNLIRMAGDHVSDEVWYRAVQIVVNNEDIQGYAAKAVFEALVRPPITSKTTNAPIASATGTSNTVVDYFYCHENLIKVAGYILGEFGNLIAGDPRSSPILQFQSLHSKFHLCSNTTKAMLLSTYVKFVNLFPEIKGHITEVLNSDYNIKSSDPEIQQRAVEYLKLSDSVSPDVLAVVLEEMPPFPENSSSASLLTRLIKDKKNKKTFEGVLTNNARSRQDSENRQSTPRKNIYGAGDVRNGHETTAGGADIVDDLLVVASPHNSRENNTDYNNSYNFAKIQLSQQTPAPPPPPLIHDKDILAQIFNDNSSHIPSSGLAIDGGLISANPLGAPYPSNLNHQAPLNVGNSFNVDPFGKLANLPSIKDGNIQEYNVTKTRIVETFVLKNTGVVYEDSLIQIGSKIMPTTGEPNQLPGECVVMLFYGNKSHGDTLINFNVDVYLENEVGKREDSNGNCGLIKFEPVQKLTVSVIGPGIQVQEKYKFRNTAPPNFDTNLYENSIPRLKIQFERHYTASGIHSNQQFPNTTIDPFSDDFGSARQTKSSHCVISSPFPLTLNKFCDTKSQQTKMDQSGFFQRWRALVNPGQEYQKIFNAPSLPIDASSNNEKIANFGLTVLDNIDANPDNTVATGIILTESQPIGCLLRLEPNRKTSMYRLTIRSTRPAVSKELGSLLADYNIL